MRSILIPILVALPAGSLAAQMTAFYPLDESCGDTARNYALGTASPSSPRNMITTYTSASQWAPGRWGTALRGLDAGQNVREINVVDVDSGLSSVDADWTMGFWLRQRSARAGYQVIAAAIGATVGTIQMQFTSGSGHLNYHASPNMGVTTTADIYALAQGSWVHIALVHDATNSTATFYVNGSAESPISLSTPIPPPVKHRFGRSIVGRCHYDIDEITAFRNALTPTEVSALANQPQSGFAGLNAGQCNPGLSLDWLGGPPVMGSQRTLQIQLPAMAPAGSAVAVSFGDDLCNHLGVPLPLSLGAVLPQWPGCNLVASQNLALVSFLTPSRGAAIQVPVVIPPSALPLSLYLQPFAVAPTGTVWVGHGLALTIGR